MKSLKEIGTPLAILIMAGVMLYDHLAPHNALAPVPAADGVALGKSFAPRTTCVSVGCDRSL
jgi:hypothetical protein